MHAIKRREKETGKKNKRKWPVKRKIILKSKDIVSAQCIYTQTHQVAKALYVSTGTDMT